jgi:hypothetical protein
LAQLPLIFDPSGEYFSKPGIYADLCMPTVLGTVAISAFIDSYMITKRTSMEANPNKNNKIEKNYFYS